MSYLIQRRTFIRQWYSELDSADIANSKSIAKFSDNVATSTLLDRIVLEVIC